MEAVLLLIISTQTVGQYQGPLRGDVKNAKFDFVYEADWNKSGQVINIIQHKGSNLLPISWPSVRIDRTLNPIKPGEPPVRNSFWVGPVSPDRSGLIFYGPMGAEQPAAYYDNPKKEAEAGVPAVVNSFIEFGDGDEAIRFDVISTYVNQEVIYSFIQNRSFHFSARFDPMALEGFGRLNIRTAEMAKVEGVERLKEAKWDQEGFGGFMTVMPRQTRYAITFKNARPKIEQRLFLVSTDEKLIGTGMISLHVDSRE